jgi:hypothetical protein
VAEEHGNGTVHFAAEVGGMHFAVYQTDPSSERPPRWRNAGNVFPGFYVDSLDDALAAVAGLAVDVFIEHDVCPWGCRAVVEDPDGHAVELNQRGHCLNQADQYV